MLVVLEFLNSTTAASDEPMLKALQQIAQQPISGLKLYSIPQNPNPPKQDLEEKSKRRREKHERKAMMKE
jgi:hypothetical protein